MARFANHRQLRPVPKVGSGIGTQHNNNLHIAIGPLETLDPLALGSAARWWAELTMLTLVKGR